MADFSFVSDEVLRKMIERDKQEMDKCVSNDLAKSALILAGSIIEAILVDYFLAFPLPNKSREDTLKADLFKLIDWAQSENLISHRSKDLSTVIRGFRNLIHPGKEYRLKEEFDMESAKVAASLVEMVIKDISKNYATRLGYTADQAYQKVMIDPTCSAIFPHMVAKMSTVEKVKLYMRIPSQNYKEDVQHVYVKSFRELHKLLDKDIPEQIKKDEIEKIYQFTHTKSKMQVLYHLQYHYENFSLLENEKQDVIIDYVLGVLLNSDISELEQLKKWNIEHCGSWFKNAVTQVKLAKFIEEAVYKISKVEEEFFLRIVDDMLWFTPQECVELIKSTLQDKEYGRERAQYWETKLNGCPF